MLLKMKTPPWNRVAKKTLVNCQVLDFSATPCIYAYIYTYICNFITFIVYGDTMLIAMARVSTSVHIYAELKPFIRPLLAVITGQSKQDYSNCP